MIDNTAIPVALTTDETMQRSILFYGCAYAFQLLAAINHEAHTVYIEDEWFLNHVTPNALNIRVKLKNILNNASMIRAYIEPLNSLISMLNRIDYTASTQLELASIVMYQTSHSAFWSDIPVLPIQAPSVFSKLILDRIGSIESYLIEALNALKHHHDAMAAIEEILDLSDLSTQLIKLSEEIARIFPFLEASLIGYMPTSNGYSFYCEPVHIGYST